VLISNNITIQFGAKPLFENVSVKFGDGNRYGLIGANGCGKSTFMKILAGVLEPTSGNVSLDKNERMSWLKQDQFAYEDQRVLDVVMMGHEEMWKANEEKNAIYMNPDATEEDYMKAAELEGVYAEFDGYTAEARAGELLIGVGIPIEQHQGPMSAVAPGFKLRVLLAQAIFSNPDILLLDEPTNNLDIHTIQWLEDTLNNRNSTMIIISHDRHFLNQVCTHQYPYIRFDYDDKDKLHRQAVEIKNLSHGFDRVLFNNFNLLVEAGERIAVIGENGIGKTTFLRCLAGDLKANHGEIKWAEKAKIGYFAQDHATDFEKDVTLFDWMKDCAQSGEDDQAIRSILGRLLFSGEDTKKSVKVLSGGEQGRMLFGKLMLSKSNVLLMDEPTNHMDMESIESLNTALDKYKGTLFFVSHDREFVSSIATRILEIKSDRIIDFTGNYEEYLLTQAQAA